MWYRVYVWWWRGDFARMSKHLKVMQCIILCICICICIFFILLRMRPIPLTTFTTRNIIPFRLQLGINHLWISHDRKTHQHLIHLTPSPEPHIYRLLSTYIQLIFQPQHFPKSSPLILHLLPKFSLNRN